MPAHISHGEVKLGRQKYQRRLSTVPLGNYLDAPAKFPYPQVCAWERPIDWGMLGNDRVGDCTIAAALHLIMMWASVAHAGSPVAFSEADALNLYSVITGYNPAEPSTDQGAAEPTVLDYWKLTGMLGHKIVGYASVDVGNVDMVKAATWLFGGLYLGIDVPSYIMQVPNGGSWSTPKGADTSIEGGHAIPIVGYGRAGYRIVSWGTTYTFNPEFLAQYCEEAYAPVSTEWIKQSGKTPSGLDLQGLLSDLAQV